MYKSIHDVTLASLKRWHKKIHYFGLGFIQIKLSEKYRIHFYTDKLPAIIGDEDVHNHRRPFTSEIYFGEFHQEIWSITNGDTHLLGDESCKEGVDASKPEVLCGLQKDMSQCFKAGSSYTIEPHVFHSVNAKKAITFLTQGPTVKEFAQVARKKDAQKVCPFSKKIPEDELWGIVEEMLNEAHASLKK